MQRQHQGYRHSETSNPQHECNGRQSPAPRLVPLFEGTSAREFAVGPLLWAYASLSFWVWWLDGRHNIGTPAFITTSAILGWINLMPAYVLLVLSKAPSEPFTVVRTTLEAMLHQDYPDPYDVWLADEDPAPDTIAWSAQHGVRVSTRRGRPDYHRPTWPRRTRCKEGNLAYSYDVHGYENHDFVCQFDADHVPQPDYPTEALRPFSDPAVGYVSAPSANCNTSRQVLPWCLPRHDGRRFVP